MLDTPITPTVPQDAQLPLRLVVPRDLAIREVENQIKIGRAIKDQRIKNGWELDHARAEKQEWVVRTTELLKRLFTDGTVADDCHNWTAAILPEYAAFGEFIALFQDEMKHRLGNLKGVIQKIEEIPETLAIRAAEVGLANAVAEANAAAPAAMNIAPIAPVAAAPIAPIAPVAAALPVAAPHAAPASSTFVPSPAPIAAPAVAATRGHQKEEPPMIQHMVPT